MEIVEYFHRLGLSPSFVYTSMGDVERGEGVGGRGRNERRNRV